MIRGDENFQSLKYIYYSISKTIERKGERIVLENKIKICQKVLEPKEHHQE